jgi:enoyl-CoA hydratase
VAAIQNSEIAVQKSAAPLCLPGEPGHFTIEERQGVNILRLCSEDGQNRLTRARVLALTDAVRALARQNDGRPLIITGNQHFFSAGADLAEVIALNGPTAYEFSFVGQALMQAVDDFPAPVCAAVHGHCFGGGLDLALACDTRIAHPHAVFGHRGAALGLITGWGGTQRLPRLIGKGKALELFVAAEKLHASAALKMGLINAIADDPLAEAVRRITT